MMIDNQDDNLICCFPVFIVKVCVLPLPSSSTCCNIIQNWSLPSYGKKYVISTKRILKAALCSVIVFLLASHF